MSLVFITTIFWVATALLIAAFLARRVPLSWLRLSQLFGGIGLLIGLAGRCSITLPLPGSSWFMGTDIPDALTADMLAGQVYAGACCLILSMILFGISMVVMNGDQDATESPTHSAR